MLYVKKNEAQAPLVVSSEYTKDAIAVPNDFPLQGLSTYLDFCKCLASITIRNKYTDIMSAIRSNYTVYELESFQDQRLEWKAWLSDNTALTPIVDALALSRGIPREMLLQKIGEKVTYLITIQGEQNSAEDSVASCNSLEDLAALGYNYV